MAELLRRLFIIYTYKYKSNFYFNIPQNRNNLGLDIVNNLIKKVIHQFSNWLRVHRIFEKSLFVFYPVLPLKKKQIAFTLSILAFTLNGISQDNHPRIQRKEDWPKFWIVGVSDAGFPVLTNQFDENSMTEYGKQILNWIDSHPEQYAKLSQDTNAIDAIRYRDVYAFKPEQKAQFKEISARFRLALEFQKNRYFTSSPNQEAKKHVKPKTRPAVYLISQYDLLYWRKQTGL